MRPPPRRRGSCAGSFRIGPQLRASAGEPGGPALIAIDHAPFLDAELAPAAAGTFVARPRPPPPLSGEAGRSAWLEWEGATVELVPLREGERLPLELLLGGDFARGAVALRAIPAARRELDSRLEMRLNALGYELLGRGETAAALRAMELNAELFPLSPNTWDSLARCSSRAARGLLRALVPSRHQLAPSCAARRRVARLDSSKRSAPRAPHGRARTCIE